MISQRDKIQKLRRRGRWEKLLCPFQLLFSASVYQPRSLNSAPGIGMKFPLHKWGWLNLWPLMINSVSSSHLTGALWRNWGPSHSVTCLAPLTHSEALRGSMQNYLAKHRCFWKQKFMNKNNKMFLSPPNQSRNYKCLRTQGQRPKMHHVVSRYTCTVMAATVRWWHLYLDSLNELCRDLQLIGSKSGSKFRVCVWAGHVRLNQVEENNESTPKNAQHLLSRCNKGWNDVGWINFMEAMWSLG